MTTRSTRPVRKHFVAAAAALAILVGSCSDGDDTASPPFLDEIDPPPVDERDGSTAEPDHGEAEKDARIAAWAGRPLPDILAAGFATEPCGEESATATVLGDGWAFLPLPLEVVDLPGLDDDTRPAVVLEGDEVFPAANAGDAPTHAWIDDDDVPMLANLTDIAAAESGAEVVLSIGSTDQGRAGEGSERPAFASAAWILTADSFIPFSGECDDTTAFVADVGDPQIELPLLRTDPRRRAELAGLTADELLFTECRNAEPGLTRRVGFGGEEVGFAFGPWPSDADTFADIGVDGWTVVPPGGEAAPSFLERGDEGFPRGAGLDPNGWLLTFTVTEDRAEVDTIFHADPVLGLRVWHDSDAIDPAPCFEARQVLAFREFLDGRVPDRPAWDLSPARPGDEPIVMETLRLLMTNTEVQAKFHEWTPCTDKLCEADGVVDR